MNYRYKVEGIAEKAFILRGMYFRIGAVVNIEILESEFTFVKERCRLEKIEDVNAKTKCSQPIPNNSSTTPKGVKNELPKSTSRGNKGTNTSKV
jgi:hypothetical protein